MEHKNNYGLIIRHLRKTAGLSLQKLAKRIGKSQGWISEIENNTGTCRLSEKEFQRIVNMLDGNTNREMFRTWVANHNNAERVERTFDGAVIKYIRLKKGIRMRQAAKLAGLTEGYLCKLESSLKPMTIDMRKRLMIAYGYNPSSFKNLSTDPVRSKAVPLKFKLEILLKKLPEEKVAQVFEFTQSIFKGALK